MFYARAMRFKQDPDRSIEIEREGGTGRRDGRIGTEGERDDVGGRERQYRDRTRDTETNRSTENTNTDISTDVPTHRQDASTIRVFN